MKISADRKCTLTTVSIVCFAAYVLGASLVYSAIEPGVYIETAKAIEKYFFWIGIVFAGLLMIQLEPIYRNKGNQALLVKTAIFGALIIPAVFAVLCYFGIVILVCFFLVASFKRLF